jgi:dipeptidyl aminopeptidase/acylaminoacyl peptidase
MSTFYRRGAILASLAAVVGLQSCAVNEKGGSPSPSPSPSPAASFSETSTISRENGVIVERVAYLSGDLRIGGEVCRPDDNARHPVVLWNHGGFEGIGSVDRDFCQRSARAGYVAGLSQYRGEGGSAGMIEFCNGEVDDVDRMLTILAAQPYADSSRLASLGASHGGCITTRLALRRPALRAAIDIVGPGDLAILYNWWVDQLARNEPFCQSIGKSGCAEQHGIYVAVATAALGGPPALRPEGYALRSPTRTLSQLRVPMLFIHGTYDEIVTVDQTCAKRAALEGAGRTVRSWMIDNQYRPQPDSTVCGGRFRSDAVPAALADDLYVFLYDRQGHSLSPATIDAAWSLTLSFLSSHL